MKLYRILIVLLIASLSLPSCTSKVPPEIQKFMESHCATVAGEHDFQVQTIDDGGAIIKEGKNIETEVTVNLPAGEHWIGTTAGAKLETDSPKIDAGELKNNTVEMVKTKCKQTQWWHFNLKSANTITFVPIKPGLQMPH